MALTNKEGWLYFLGEIDFKTGEKFGYVKIGKTDYDRPVSDRSSDHQTGNPRHIVEVADSIRTNFIDNLETYMHHRFATKRVHGEWFQLSDYDLAEAVKEANRVNDLLNTVLTDSQEVSEMSKSESNGKTIAANKTVLADYQEFVANEKQRALHKLNQEIVAAKMRNLTSSFGGLDEVSVLSLVARPLKFNKADFEKDHPTIVAKYMKTEEKMARNFSISNKPSAAKTYPEINQDFKELKEKYEDISSVKDSLVSRDSTIESLHQEWLELHESEAEVMILSEIFSLKLQHACGENEAIEDVCKWKRQVQEKTSLDTTALKEGEPTLYASYQVTQSPTVRYKVTPYRCY